MSTDNIALMRKAQEALKGKWGIAIATFLIYSIIFNSGGISYKIGNGFSAMLNAVALIFGGTLSLGAAIFSLTIVRGGEARVEQLFDGFKYFVISFFTYILMVLIIILWSFLLIIPGVIAALSYSMTFYILADNRTLKPHEVLDRSKKMMNGYKMKLFYLYLRFFLLALLCILTLGIGFLWLIPYVNVTLAEFYEDIRGGEMELV